MGVLVRSEITPRWQATDWWRVEGSYSLLKMDLRNKSGSLDRTSVLDEGKSPQQQIVLRSLMNLPHNLELDLGMRYVDSLPSLGVDSYVVADARLGWRPKSYLEVAIVGQHLIGSPHTEFRSSIISTQQTEVEHSIFGTLTLRF